VRLWPRLSTRQIAGHLARTTTSERITDLAKRLDVDLDRPVGELSRGNRQKAGCCWRCSAIRNCCCWMGVVDPLIKELSR